MFETLVVSRPAIRADGRAGLTALGLHLVVFAVAIQVRPTPLAPMARAHELPRFFFTTTTSRAPASSASPVSSGITPAPRALTGELHLPAIPSIPASPASRPLNLAQMIGGGRGEQAGPLAVPGVEEVERGPVLATPFQPRYPAALRVAGVRGEAVVEYVVDQAGRVDTSSVRAAWFSHPGFVAPIREALAGARFIPAQRGGVPVAVRVRQRIVFEIR